MEPETPRRVLAVFSDHEVAVVALHSIFRLRRKLSEGFCRWFDHGDLPFVVNLRSGPISLSASLASAFRRRLPRKHASLRQTKLMVPQGRLIGHHRPRRSDLFLEVVQLRLVSPHVSARLPTVKVVAPDSHLSKFDFKTIALICVHRLVGRNRRGDVVEQPRSATVVKLEHAVVGGDDHFSAPQGSVTLTLGAHLD